jgi:hypothetical protein
VALFKSTNSAGAADLAAALLDAAESFLAGAAWVWPTETANKKESVVSITVVRTRLFVMTFSPISCQIQAQQDARLG